MLLVLGSAPLYAQSAKNAVQVSSLALISETSSSGGWVTILGDASPLAASAVRIRTSQQKDLIFGAAFECGLYTQTKVRSGGGNKDTSSAEATVDVRIVVDPGTPDERMAHPGGTTHDNGVTFCERSQTLSATLQGILELACQSSDGYLTSCDLNVVDEEEIELVQRTLAANAFFFALDDLGSGTHNVIVQARINSATSSQNGSAGATALIGQGSLTVEEVRLVRGTDIDLAP
jgi:hypothetical protein